MNFLPKDIQKYIQKTRLPVMCFVCVCCFIRETTFFTVLIIYECKLKIVVFDIICV